MSLPWMPLYIGDYLRDTANFTTEQHGAYVLLLMHAWQHGTIPASSAERATITRTSPRHWKQIGGAVEQKFRADGSHKRVEEEREKTKRKVMQRTLAGQKGGIRSGISRAIKAGSNEANVKQNRSKQPSKSQAATKLPSTNHISKITTTESIAPREDETDQSARSLASALPVGALTSEPLTEQAAQGLPTKKPCETTRAEMEAFFAKKHAVAG